MAVAKVERLLTLIQVLLDSPKPIRSEELRRRVPGYPESSDSFKRAFERDKAELREMGVPFRVELVPASDPPVLGYRIRREEYALRDPGLEPDELEALHLAAAVVGSSDGLGQRALYKLGGAATAGEPAAEIPADPDLVAAFTGVAERRALSFAYRDRARTVDPHRLEFARGRWYLLGLDHGHGERRWFRLSRVTGGIAVADQAGSFERPTDPVQGLLLDPWGIGGESDPVAAEVWFDPEVAPTVRAEIGAVTVLRDDDDGLVVELRVTNHEGFRSWLLSFLDRAELLGPPELRAELVDWLTEVGRG